MRNLKIKCDLSSVQYSKGEISGQASAIGHMKHPQFGEFAIGASVEPPFRLIVVHIESGRSMAADCRPLAECMAAEMFKI